MPPPVEVNGWGQISKRRKGGRTILRPVYVGLVLVVMYIVFVYLILNTFEDNTVRDSGAAYHLRKSVSRAMTVPFNGQAGSSSGKDENDDKRSSAPTPAPIRVSSHLANEASATVKHPSSLEIEHPDLIDFCGECLWKDTVISCNKRVEWEVEQGRRSSEFESKKSNLVHCKRPPGMHLSDFCGACRWKKSEYNCDERVDFEVEKYNRSMTEARWRNLAHCRNPPYALSPLCGGCARSSINVTSENFRGGTPCINVMKHRVKAGLASTMMEAAEAVGEEFEQCRRCAPATCWKDYFKMSPNANQFDKTSKGFLTKYWRFDRAAPNMTYPTSVALPSIPKEFRIPPSRFRDIEAFLTEKYNDFESSTDAHVKLFFEYDPSLAPIPPNMKSNLPKYTAYALALRVTPANGCFERETMAGLPQEVWDHTMASPANLLGIALLDEEYEILPGYDIVVDIATQLGLQRHGYGTTYFGEPTFTDYRFFALNGNLYLRADGDATIVSQLDLRSTMHSKSLGGLKLDVVHGEGGLEVTMLQRLNAVWSREDGGGNAALFAVPNRSHPHEPDSVYAEVEISPHGVQQLYLDEVDTFDKNFGENRIRRNQALDGIMRRKVATGNLTNSKGIEPDPSFFTVDEHWFPGNGHAFRNNGRGGACCVSLSWSEVLAGGEHISLTHKSWGDNNDHLLVGVAHAGTDGENGPIPHAQHVSFFYAFEPRPPFDLRVRSGYFCLGFAGDAGGEGGGANPHSVLTLNRKLSLNDETFHCPRTHLVSSFVEKVGDPSWTVIGYGINDCTPRIVEVSKGEIARILFSDPWEMKVEKESSEYDRSEAENLDIITSALWNWKRSVG